MTKRIISDSYALDGHDPECDYRMANKKMDCNCWVTSDKNCKEVMRSKMPYWIEVQELIKERRK